MQRPRKNLSSVKIRPLTILSYPLPPATAQSTTKYSLLIVAILIERTFQTLKSKSYVPLKKGIPLAEKPLEKDSNQRKLKLKQKSQDTEDDKYKKK